MNQVLSHAHLMDSIYRYQRYIYDFTRKYYLFGRDSLIREMEIKSGDCILEMGCGTARNLIALAKIHPNAVFYGLDASQEMLRTAEKKIARKNLDNQIILCNCLAEDVHYSRNFNLEEPFDCVFFSYCLSMVPSWNDAIHAALSNLKPGGYLYIVDFWDQAGLPFWFQRLLQSWLNLFHVKYKPELLFYLQSLHHDQFEYVKIDSILARYAFKAKFIKN